MIFSFENGIVSKKANYLLRKYDSSFGCIIFCSKYEVEVEVPLSCLGTLVKERKGAAAAAINERSTTDRHIGSQPNINNNSCA